MCFFFFTVDNILHLQNQCAITPCDPYGVRNGLYGATKSSPKMLVCVCVCVCVACSSFVGQKNVLRCVFKLLIFFFFFFFLQKELLLKDLIKSREPKF